ncbi:MAG: hypothetical protein ABI367_00030 [Mucilaginibacter sp.]
MNKFSKPIFVALLIMGIGYSSFAQRTQNNITPANDNLPRESQTRKVQIIKENFIVRELALSPADATKFLHIYRSYQNALSEIRRLKRLNNSSSQTNGNAQLDKDLSYDRKLIDTKEYYQNEFLKIMSPEKVSKMYKSEQTFKDEIFRNLNERQN